MKRLLIVFFALLTTVSFAGCSTVDAIVFPQKEEIEFSADNPVYSDKDLRTKTHFYQLENRAKDDDYDIFKDFSSYYANNIKNKVNGKYYLLNPGDGLTGWVPHNLYKSFYLFADDLVENKYVNSLILEEVELNDISIKENKPNSEIIDGGSDWNIRLSIIFAPIYISESTNNYNLEFGNNSTDSLKTYINIYREQDCFATCFYESKSELTYDWFANYFKKNLTMEI